MKTQEKIIFLENEITQSLARLNEAELNDMGYAYLYGMAKGIIESLKIDIDVVKNK